ncbi:MAG: nuclear transport factor 2 family protein [Pseudomonadota bacterium]
MSFEALLREVAKGVETADGARVAAAFAEDGVYRDVFYGDFRGRAAIREMVEERFHRDGEAFRWEMFDVVEGEGRGYARYLFSYLPKRPEATGRVVFEGIVSARLSGGLILDYDEVAEAAVALSSLGTEDARLAAWVAKRAECLRGRPDAARHLR